MKRLSLTLWSPLPAVAGPGRGQQGAAASRRREGELSGSNKRDIPAGAGADRQTQTGNDRRGQHRLRGEEEGARGAAFAHRKREK